MQEICTERSIAVLGALIKDRLKAGLTPDPTILDLDEIELKEARLVDSEPILIITFNTQQVSISTPFHAICCASCFLCRDHNRTWLNLDSKLCCVLRMGRGGTGALKTSRFCSCCSDYYLAWHSTGSLRQKSEK